MLQKKIKSFNLRVKKGGRFMAPFSINLEGRFFILEEYWDLLFPDGTPSGETLPASQRIPDGRCTLLVHIFICDAQGNFLLQKRSMKKKYFPGVWDSTGGRVQAGESSPAAAVREIYEEVGLCITPENLLYLGRERLPWRNLLDLYAVRADFTLEQCRMQKEEVDALRLVPYSQALDIFTASKEAFYIAAFQHAADVLGAK